MQREKVGRPIIYIYHGTRKVIDMATLGYPFTFFGDPLPPP